MDTAHRSQRPPFPHRGDEPMRSPHVRRLLLAKGLRAFGDGYVSLLLPVYLLQLGFSALQVGIIATATLVGSGLLTLGVGLQAYRYHYRAMLLAATALMARTGIGFAAVTDFWPMLVVALVGTLNPSSGDVSVFLPLEHAVMSRLVDDRSRTATFARYSLVGSLVAAVGSLAAGIASIAAANFGVTTLAATKGMFLLYALIAGRRGLVYRGLPRALATEVRQPMAPLQQSKRACTRWRHCSASTPSAEVSSCSRWWRCGSTSVTAYRWRRRA